MDKRGEFTTIGASAHSLGDREENDFYATDPKALEVFLPEISFRNVWECACGQGHLAEVLKNHNLLGKASDLIDRGLAEQNKYYEPSIKELHIGYICETALLPQNDWSGSGFCEKKLTISDLCGIDDLDLAVQTKYLDDEDIKSLGWTWDEHWYIIKVDGIQYAMHTESEGNKDKIWYIQSDKGDGIIFIGTIKSINELKLVMKFIEITNE